VTAVPPMKSMKERQTDADLIYACQNGDSAAFQSLFEAYKDSVYSIAFHFSGNQDMANDITQQTFLKVFAGLKNFRSDSALSTWIYRITANACTDERRSRHRLVPLSDGLELGSTTARGSAEERIYRRQISVEVKNAIAGLKPKLRMAIVLKYVEELSYEEIGQVLGCSMGTVASRLNRGHKALAKKLAHLRGAIESGNEDAQ
jgi:RNA polymerase sigma-70 factor, ECF subfamily